MSYIHILFFLLPRLCFQTFREQDYTYCILQLSGFCHADDIPASVHSNQARTVQSHTRGVKSFVSFRFLTGARRLQVAPDPGVRRLEPVGRHARHPVLPGRDLLLRRAGGEGRRGSLQGAPVPCQAIQLQEGETKQNFSEDIS